MKLTILCYLLWSRWRGMKEAERQKGEKEQESDGWWAIGEIKEVIIGDGSGLTASWDCSQLPDATLRCSGEWNHWRSAFNTSLSRGQRREGGVVKWGSFLLISHFTRWRRAQQSAARSIKYRCCTLNKQAGTRWAALESASQKVKHLVLCAGRHA